MAIHKVPDQASTKLPTLGASNKVEIVVPEFDLHFYSDEEGGNHDGMESQADDVNLMQIRLFCLITLN